MLLGEPSLACGELVARGAFLLLRGPAVCARVMLLGGLLGGCNGAPSAPPPAGQGGRANLGTYPRATLRECRCKQHRTHVAPALATATLLDASHLLGERQEGVSTLVSYAP